MADRGRPLKLEGAWRAWVDAHGGRLRPAVDALREAGVKASPRTLERWAAHGVPLRQQDAVEAAFVAAGLESPC